MITFNNVTKIYTGNVQPTLSRINCTIEDGEFVALVGLSGCGKSTFLKIIAGLEGVTTGTIEKPDSVSMVFQSGALFPWFTVFDNIALVLRVKGISEAIIREKVTRTIEMMKLTGFENQYPADLSGGQRQRVGIARALIIDPQVLLLDEPFSALDVRTTAELHEDLLRVWEERRQTIVMVSHSVEEAVSLADRVMVMDQGQIENIVPIHLPYPRREQEAQFMNIVQKIRKEFFKNI